GIPVITHENTGFAELYPKTLADFLTKTPDDVDELAAKIRRCYASPEWTQASNIVLRAKDEALSATRVRPQEPEEEPEAVQTEGPEPQIAEDRRARLAARGGGPTVRV